MSEYPVSIETETDQLIRKIQSSLEAPGARGYVGGATRRRQTEILRNLPQDFAIGMKAFALMTESQTEDPLRRQMFGEVFEELVRADPKICPRKETPEAEQIRALLKLPEMFGLQEYGLDRRHMNPDVARVDEEGRIVGAVEVKSGKIDHRGYEQVGRFEENITAVVQKLKKIPVETLREHGLEKIAENQDKLEVSPDFKLVLAVPYGVYFGEVRQLLKEEDFYSEEKIKQAEERIGNCEIIESPFSRREVAVITDCIIEWIQKSRG